MKASVEDRFFFKIPPHKATIFTLLTNFNRNLLQYIQKKTLQSFSQNYSLNRRAIHQANTACYCNRTLFLVTFYHAASRPL